MEEKEATANALKKVVRSGKPAKAEPQPAKPVKEKTRRLEKPAKEKSVVFQRSCPLGSCTSAVTTFSEPAYLQTHSQPTQVLSP